MPNKPSPGARSLQRLVLRLVCAAFGHKYTRVEHVGAMRIESEQWCDGERLCYRCHPCQTLKEQMAEYEKSENEVAERRAQQKGNNDE